MKKKYYHYTSLSCLFSIITTQELWLCNLKNSNDPNEFYLSCNDYNDYVKSTGLNPYNGRPYILPNNSIYGNTYGLSFTTLSDNLSHWERYGDLLRGVSILFDVDSLQKELKRRYNFSFNFDSIKYTESEKIAFIKKNLDKIDFIPQCPRARKNLEALYFIEYFNQSQMLFKKSMFRSEREYRLYFDPTYFEFFYKFITTLNGDLFNDIIKDISVQFENVKHTLKLLNTNKHYAIMKNGINSYLALNLCLIDKNKFIKEIILGPKCPQDICELQNFLHDHGYDIPISKSTVELR